MSERPAGPPVSRETEQSGSRADSQPLEGNDPGTDDLSAELAAMEARYKRAVADLDNYRKRSRSEIERRSYEQRERLLRDWLEVVDNIERALRHAQEDDPLVEGMQAVLDQINQVMQRQGVRRLGAPGEPFDPEYHQAVAVHQTEDVPDRTVVELVRGGYALGDRVLRPAQVIVARPREAAS